MFNRPILTSLLGWGLILLYGLAFMLLLVFWDRPELAHLATGYSMPLAWYKGGALVESFAMVIAGIGILKGLDWSRYLFVGVHIGDPLISYVVDSKIPIGPVYVAVVVTTTIYLFRPAASEWFG